MSTTYNDLDLTTFPESIDTMQVMQDPNRSQLVKILSYETLLRGGDYDSAAAFLEANPELKDMQITAEKMNRHEQMIIAIERMFKEDIDAYIRAAENSITGDIQNSVAIARNEAARASSDANYAKEIAEETSRYVDEKLTGCVRVVTSGGLYLLAGNWTQEGDLYVQELELDEMTTSGRMRYTLGNSSIGKVFIAGVICPRDGWVRVLSFNKPEGSVSIMYRVEEEVAG